MKRWHQIGTVIIAVALSTAPAIAQEVTRPKALSIRATILNPAEGTHQDGPEAKRRNALYPGDVVRYELVFTNVTDVPVRNVEFTDPVPNGLTYVSGSSRADATDAVIEFSIDDGSTYHVTPLVTHVVDGEQFTEPAPAHLYTHIRWRVLDLIQPGAQVTAEFRAMLPGHTKPNTPDSSRTGRDG